MIVQESQLDIAERELGVAFGHFAARQSHAHEAPSDHGIDGIDGDRALEPLGGPAGRLHLCSAGRHGPFG